MARTTFNSGWNPRQWKLYRKLLNLLASFGVTHSQGVIEYPLTSGDTIKCNVLIQDEYSDKPFVRLVVIEEAHGYKVDDMINPRPLLVALEIWMRIVVPALNSKKERVNPDKPKRFFHVG